MSEKDVRRYYMFVGKHVGGFRRQANTHHGGGNVGNVGFVRRAGRRHREPPPTTLRELTCLEQGMVPDQVLGQGDYGSVWSLKSAADPSAANDWILKVSDIADAERKESFDREVYFLKRLQGTGLVPELKVAKAC